MTPVRRWSAATNATLADAQGRGAEPADRPQPAAQLAGELRAFLRRNRPESPSAPTGSGPRPRRCLPLGPPRRADRARSDRWSPTPSPQTAPRTRPRRQKDQNPLAHPRRACNQRRRSHPRKRQKVPRLVVTSAVKLLLLLDTHRSETLNMRWVDMDGTPTWTVPGMFRRGRCTSCLAAASRRPEGFAFGYRQGSVGFRRQARRFFC
jgi:hypothetical protein